YMSLLRPLSVHFFFITAPPTTDLSTLSLHDALPISARRPTGHEDLDVVGRPEFRDRRVVARGVGEFPEHVLGEPLAPEHVLRKLDRKSTRLNSSHVSISYAVFCLKKKKEHTIPA